MVPMAGAAQGVSVPEVGEDGARLGQAGGTSGSLAESQALRAPCSCLLPSPAVRGLPPRGPGGAWLGETGRTQQLGTHRGWYSGCSTASHCPPPPSPANTGHTGLTPVGPGQLGRQDAFPGELSAFSRAGWTLSLRAASPAGQSRSVRIFLEPNTWGERGGEARKANSRGLRAPTQAARGWGSEGRAQTGASDVLKPRRAGCKGPLTVQGKPKPPRDQEQLPPRARRAPPRQPRPCSRGSTTPSIEASAEGSSCTTWPPSGNSPCSCSHGHGRCLALCGLHPAHGALWPGSSTNKALSFCFRLCAQPWSCPSTQKMPNKYV